VTPIMTAADINELLMREYPQFHSTGKVFDVISVGPGTGTLRFFPNESHLRAGGTISGPSMFALADVGAYITLLAHLGPVVGCVTANMNINFLHRPDPEPLDGIGRILKLGKRLAVLDVMIVSAGTDHLIAQAITTFSIPG
jgi:acyl-coenzyme A thioesterase PaaI-like protein